VLEISARNQPTWDYHLDGGLVNADSTRAGKRKVAFNTLRFEVETDAAYYHRIDELHWGRLSIQM
jgi:hypothetical protein